MTDLTMPPGFAPVHNRYVLPSFVERSSNGMMKETNPYNKMFEDRIIFLGVQVDDASANDVMAQLLTLESSDPDRDILMYINSPGGSFTAMTAIYDTMQYVRPDISTVCLGQAASAAAVLLAGGSAGKRMALPHARIMMHQPSGGIGGTASDIAIQAEQMLYTKKMFQERVAHHTGQSLEQIEADSDRDRWFTAGEARDYGFIDRVITGAEQAPEGAGTLG